MKPRTRARGESIVVLVLAVIIVCKLITFAIGEVNAINPALNVAARIGRYVSGNF